MAFRVMAAALCAITVVGCVDEPVTAPLERNVSAARINDLDPDAPGIFLADVYPGVCFKDQNPSAPDEDWDWLANDCEYALAHAFRPLLVFGENEECPVREPAWAAKVFNGTGHVRLAYMPAYHDDCGHFGGDLRGHPGDSEFIMIEIWFDASTNHWRVQQAFLSAHHGTSAQESVWVSGSQLQYPERPFGHPRIWVATNKHANYISHAHCDQVFWWETCSNGTNVRLEVLSGRNAGSRFSDLLGCISSTINIFTPRCEGFFFHRKFNGWYAVHPDDTGVKPYWEWLYSTFFEYRQATPSYIDPGPGPGLPGSGNPYSATIQGPDFVTPGATCHYYVLHNVPDPTVQWYANGALVGTGEHLYYASGVSFTLQVVVSAASGGADHSKSVGAIEQPTSCGDI
jgi:hypothetical protein